MNFALAHSSCGKICRSVRSEAQQRPPSGGLFVWPFTGINPRLKGSDISWDP
jgi:hypothetical protein